MKKELEDRLFKNFPNLFPNGRNVNYSESLMCFGFACGNGWFDLIYSLCKELKDYKIVVVQVKEKFGGLRFYINSCPSEYYKEVWEKIHIVEEESFKICEECGKEGKLRQDLHWWLTLCEECYNKREKNEKRTSCNNN